MTAITAITQITETTDETPAVRLQPCAAFQFDADAAWPTCGECGWLEDDHPGAVEAGAVIELPLRRVELPRRLAS